MFPNSLSLNRLAACSVFLNTNGVVRYTGIPRGAPWPIPRTTDGSGSYPRCRAMVSKPCFCIMIKAIEKMMRTKRDWTRVSSSSTSRLPFPPTLFDADVSDTIVALNKDRDWFYENLIAFASVVLQVATWLLSATKTDVKKQEDLKRRSPISFNTGWSDIHNSCHFAVGCTPKLAQESRSLRSRIRYLALSL